MKPIVWICLLLAIACSISGGILDPDLWWHIVIGRWILAHQEFPVVDYWNSFGIGTPWRAYSWLFEVAVAPIDRHFGDRGLLVAQVLLLAAICGVICYSYRVISRSWFFGTYLGVIVTSATADHFTLRPQSIVWALEAAVIAIAFSIVDDGLSRKRLLALVLTMCLWANLHITTAIGLGIVSSILLGAVPLQVAGIVLLAGCLGTLLTPYLGAEWLIFLSVTGHPLEFRSIAEFQPASILQFPTVFVVSMAILVGLASTRFLRTWPPLLLVGAGVILVGGLAVMKFLPMAGILLGAIVARSLGHSPPAASAAEGPWEKFIELSRHFELLWNRIPGVALTLALLVLAGIYFVPLWRDPIVKSIIPVELADRIIDESLPHPVLNDFGRGGYFIYRYSNAEGVPVHLVPIDGRTNAIPSQRMVQYMHMASGAEDWQEFFTAVDPRTVIFQTDSPLVSILEATGNWCVIDRVSGGHPGTALLLRRDEFELRRQGGRAIQAENCQ